jgi:hypothetical protein
MRGERVCVCRRRHPLYVHPVVHAGVVHCLEDGRRITTAIASTALRPLALVIAHPCPGTEIAVPSNDMEAEYCICAAQGCTCITLSPVMRISCSLHYRANRLISYQGKGFHSESPSDFTVYT